MEVWGDCDDYGAALFCCESLGGGGEDEVCKLSYACAAAYPSVESSCVFKTSWDRAGGLRNDRCSRHRTVQNEADRAEDRGGTWSGMRGRRRQWGLENS